ncbi:MAG TPA: DUF1800 domain-containing protein [Rhizomicrobium sp.]|nr:DUF1800 domain-containing protein [Rhizomicrobium sp.]
MRFRAFLSMTLMALAVPAVAGADDRQNDLAFVNRLTWGETAQGNTLNGKSRAAWLEEQLHPGADDGLPPEVQAAIARMEISQRPLEDIAIETREMQLAIRDARKTAKADDRADDKGELKDIIKPYRQKLVSLAVQAQTRSLLRDLYSKNQLKEQLTWFWLNHFNVYARKGQIAALVGDYEENAIRPRVSGKFRDLLAATVFHPAMLQYLDNQQNAADKINENYAREIMELHTMGVGSGYTQKDVQELARILTGVGVNLSGKPRPLAALARADYRTDVGKGGLFEFIPRRHDYGDKVFLGHTIKGGGLEEVNQAIDLLSREPATARFVSRQLAQYFCCDAPSDKLVDMMAATWKRSDGDIAEVLKTLFDSNEFDQSLGRKFKDPMHYAISAVRATYGNQVIKNPLPLINWLNRMGELPYGHETPDGYSLTAASWSGPGEMATRFDVAQQIGNGARNLFTPLTPETLANLRANLGANPANADNNLQAVLQPDPQDRTPAPKLQETAYYTALTPTLSPATSNAIAQGASQADRNALFLSSPEFMRR